MALNFKVRDAAILRLGLEAPMVRPATVGHER